MAVPTSPDYGSARIELTIRLPTPSLAQSYSFWQGHGGRSLSSRADERIAVPLGAGLALEVSERGPERPTLFGRGVPESIAKGLAQLPGGRKHGRTWRREGSSLDAISSTSQGRVVSLWRSVAKDRAVRVVLGTRLADDAGVCLPILGFFRPDRALGAYRRGGLWVVLADEPETTIRLEIIDPEMQDESWESVSPSGLTVIRMPA